MYVCVYVHGKIVYFILSEQASDNRVACVVHCGSPAVTTHPGRDWLTKSGISRAGQSVAVVTWSHNQLTTLPQKQRRPRPPQPPSPSPRGRAARVERGGVESAQVAGSV